MTRSAIGEPGPLYFTEGGRNYAQPLVLPQLAHL